MVLTKGERALFFSPSRFFFVVFREAGRPEGFSESALFGSLFHSREKGVRAKLRTKTIPKGFLALRRIIKIKHQE